MGCDIHGYVEVFDGEKWGTVDVLVWPEKRTRVEELLGKECLWAGTLFDFRSYSMFSVLADVRNGLSSVFSSKPTGHVAPVIAEPRGIPADASAEAKAEASDWGCDGHSRSYLTLKDLQDFDLDQSIEFRGWVGKEYYEKWDQEKQPMPDSWSGGVSPEDEYVCAAWTVPVKDACGWWFDKVLPALAALAEDPEHVRIVFWFDN